MLLTFGGRYNPYFSDTPMKILRLLNFNTLFQLVGTKFFKRELFSCLPKVNHVIKSCKEPIQNANHFFLSYLAHRSFRREVVCFLSILLNTPLVISSI